jgi:hypothetical protein
MRMSFDGTPVTLHLESKYIVAIDPLALDGLSHELAELTNVDEAEQFKKLKALGEFGLRIGLQAVESPGAYRLDNYSFEYDDSDDDDPALFDVDSGTIVLIDLPALGAVARSLTWDRYDKFLQAEPDDYSIMEAVNLEVGGPRFVMIPGDGNTPFQGDGRYRLRADRITRVESPPSH